MMVLEILYNLFFYLFFFFGRRLNEVMTQLPELEQLKERSRTAEHKVKVSYLAIYFLNKTLHSAKAKAKEKADRNSVVDGWEVLTVADRATRIAVLLRK